MGRGVSPVQAVCLLFAYLALYVFGHISNPMGGVAAIWPAHAVSFAALVLFPVRRWLLVIAVTGVAELLLVPLLHWIQAEPQPALARTLGFVAANVSTSVGAASLARLFRTVHRRSPATRSFAALDRRPVPRRRARLAHRGCD